MPRPAPSPAPNSTGPIRVPRVVAHPDDEYEVAGTLYRVSKGLGGSVDQLIITSGEGGYHWSSLAAPYYGVDLADEAVGRQQDRFENFWLFAENRRSAASEAALFAKIISRQAADKESRNCKDRKAAVGGNHSPLRSGRLERVREGSPS